MRPCVSSTPPFPLPPSPLRRWRARSPARYSRTAVERDHALAWGAHHLCAGLFVVGRDHQRTPDVVVADDIARFPWFRWEDEFTYDVDWSSERVTVRAPGLPARSAAWDLLHMSSGLDFLNLDVTGPDAHEHFRIYQDDVDVCRHAIEQPMDLPPDSQFRYRNSDPLTLTCIARRIVEGCGEAWLTWPQRVLFDRIGIRDAVLETDRYRRWTWSWCASGPAPAGRMGT